MRPRTIVYILIAVCIAAIAIRLGVRKHEVNLSVQPLPKAEAVRVTVTAVDSMTLNPIISVEGVIRPLHDVVITARSAGIITGIHAALGDRVGAGTVLATIDQRQQKLALDQAKSALDRAQSDLDKSGELLKTKAIAQNRYDDALHMYRSTRTQFDQMQISFDDTRITAPFAGTIVAKMIDDGQSVTPQMPAFEIIDGSVIEVEVALHADDAIQARKGDSAIIAAQGVVRRGQVTFISPKAGSGHTFSAVIRAQNQSKPILQLGTFARVTIHSSRVIHTLAIPRTTLIGSTKDPEVYIVEAAKAYRRRIELTATMGDTLCVKNGLAVRQQVVASGQINLVDSCSVTVVR